MADIVFLPVACILLVLYLGKVFFDRRRNNLPLPPGPKGLPLVGNIGDLPPPGAPEYQHWLKHKDRYGPISSLTILGQTMVIIHDRSVAVELMEKRASIHSGRPKMKFAFDMIGWSNTMVGQQYNQVHRLHRKYAHQQLGSKAAVSRHYAVQEVAVGRFLWHIGQDRGKNLTRHLKTEAGELILKITYDYTVEPHGHDPLIDKIDEAMGHFSESAVPGKWAVDIIPFLEHLPEWMPGAGFKRTARLWRKNFMDVGNLPFDFVKQQSSHGNSKGAACFVTKSIEQARHEDAFSPTEENAIKWVAASLYAGGADTSVSTMSAFFLAMSMFPEVQRKAQEEIDRVVGPSRLPSFADRDNLPYVCAIVEEAQRWHPIAPMGVAHASDKEDSVNGYRIPKGSLLLPAIWWFTRDPTVYHDPETFKPERFLEPFGEPPATKVTFGFGRRVCPGRQLADSSLYLIFAQSLAVFNIRKPPGGQWKETEPVHDFSSGIIAYPGAFDVEITPRSSHHESLVRKVVREHPWEESDARHLVL